MQEGIQYLNYASKSKLLPKVEKFTHLLRLISSANKKAYFWQDILSSAWDEELDQNQIDKKKIGGKHSKHKNMEKR